MYIHISILNVEQSLPCNHILKLMTKVSRLLLFAYSLIQAVKQRAHNDWMKALLKLKELSV